MKKHARTRGLVGRGDTATNKDEELPTPSMQFRRRAWRDYQRARDPLASPKPLPIKQPPQQ
jgi:hypothetical protein